LSSGSERAHWGSVSERLDALLAALIGVALFFLYCDPRILDPGQVGWLMSGDPAQQFLGWEFFRHSPLLQFPLGANPHFGTIQNSSIVFTDSLPLLALLLKPLRSLLPEPFQYQGLWIFSCFLLQPLFAFKLLGRFTTDRSLRLLGAGLFALAPPMLWRLHGHYSLLAHWTILAALAEYFSPRHRALRWALLLSVTALVHAYLLAMVAAIGCAELVRRVREGQLSRKRSASEAAAAASGLLILMWTVGYFMVHHVSGGGFGFFRMNLLAPIDPEDIWSLVLRDQPTTQGEYEGFNYLGLAVWGLLVACAPRLLDRNPPSLDWRRHAPLGVLCAALTLFAISNRVFLGSHEIFSVEIGHWLDRRLGTFRSSGRMFWPVAYVFYVSVLLLFWRSVRRSAAIRLAVVLLFLQVLDLSASVAHFRDRFDLAIESPPRLASRFWDRAGGRYRRLLVVSPSNDLAGAEPLLHFAAGHRFSVNKGYYNRIDDRVMARAQAELEETLKSKRIDADALYLFVDRDPLWRRLRRRAGSRDLFAVVDGYAVLAPGMGGLELEPEVDRATRRRARAGRRPQGDVEDQ